MRHMTGTDGIACLHTMYADKPMQGHGLMQAIDRVSREFRNESGGLVVDYPGLADQLKPALAIRDDVSYFQTVQAALNKKTTSNKKIPEQLDIAEQRLDSELLDAK